MDHHPDLDLRYTHVDVRLTQPRRGRGDRPRHPAGPQDLTAPPASALDRTAASVSRVELAPGHARTHDAILPFWAAVLAMVDLAGDDGAAIRPGALPAVWFQQSGSAEPRQHWHPDVWVDPAQVQPRIDAALAAGGTLVSDEEAPSFWVLADPEGNKVCLCTWQDSA